MAKEQKDDEEKQDDAPKKKGKKKLLLIIVIVVVVLLGGLGAFFALKGSKGKTTQEEQEETEEGGDATHGGEEGDLSGALFPLEAFIVNLQVKGSFLKTSIQLEFGQPELPAGLENQVPKIRDSILRLLSTKQAGDILSGDGKEKLKEEIKVAVNNTLGAEDVVQVYFTEFIVQ